MRKHRKPLRERESHKLGILIDEVLFYEWDPIGVKEMYDDLRVPRDEYSSYVKEISKIIQTSSEDEIYVYLQELETDNMGLSNTIWQKRARKKTAKILYNLQGDDDE